MVFQNPDHQLFSASVQEDVSFGPLNLGLDMATVRQRVAAALQAVGMAEHADKAGAQPEFRPEKARLHRRRAGHGTGTADPRRADGRPRPRHAKGTAGRARPPARSGITLLLATHDIDFAYRWAERIHLMAAGRCTASLNVAELANTPPRWPRGLPFPEIITLHRELVGARPVAAGPLAAQCGGLARSLERCEHGMTGKIWFVGAGPGDPDLMTVKARKLLEQSGAVLYAGSLVDQAATLYAPAGCEIRDSKDMTLDEMTDWLIAQAASTRPSFACRPATPACTAR
jgi:energy-coupling factor transporter ATP-binding protein EcfA2